MEISKNYNGINIILELKNETSNVTLKISFSFHCKILDNVYIYIYIHIYIHIYVYIYIIY